MSTRILLIRHGQTEWNRVERFRGRINVPLNEAGLLQADATGCHVADYWRPVAIYSSPLSRAVSTAEAIGRQTNLDIGIKPDLIDIDYGDWQGQTPADARSHWPELVDAWYKTPQQTHIPNGETLTDVRIRATRAVADLIKEHPGQTIALVSHTAVNRVILLTVLGLGIDRFWHIRQEPCAINVFEANDSDYVLFFIKRYLSS